MHFPIVYSINGFTVWQIHNVLPRKIERAISRTDPKPYSVGGSIIIMGSGFLSAALCIGIAYLTHNIGFAIGALVLVLVVGIITGVVVMKLPKKYDRLRHDLWFNHKPWHILSSAHPVFQSMLSPELQEWLRGQHSPHVRYVLFVYYKVAMSTYNEYQKKRKEASTDIELLKIPYERDLRLLEIAAQWEDSLSPHFNPTSLRKYWAERKQKLKAGIIADLRRLREDAQEEVDEADQALAAITS